MNVQLPLYVSIVLLIGLQIGVVVVASPGALGVFEYICVLTLTYFGVDATLALSVGILLHMQVYFPLFFGVLGPLWEFPLPINHSKG